MFNDIISIFKLKTNYIKLKNVYNHTICTHKLFTMLMMTMWSIVSL